MSGDTELCTIRDAIAVFPSADEQVGDRSKWIDDARRENWMPNNWNGNYDHSQQQGRKRLCDELANVNGPILEVAAGPGGGNLSPVLRRNPNASILVTDIVPQILELWQAFLLEKALGQNVSFAAFDAKEMPIRDNSIAAVSSAGGFDNIANHDLAIREAVRVLLPGGRLFAFEFAFDLSDIARLPLSMRDSMATESPATVRGWRSLLEDAGLRLDWHETTAGRDLVPEEGGLPNEAAKHGVTLRVRYEYFIASK